MKIKSLLAICLLAASVLSYGQLSRIVLQPDGGGSPQVFLNFDDAINAAQSNDRLYLSGGGFQSSEQITLDFPIHFIGAGIHPDSTTVTNATTLTTSDAIVLNTGASNSKFTGIKFISQSAFNFEYGTMDENDDPTGLYFERCEFQEHLFVTSVLFSAWSNSESFFNECVFRGDLRGANNASVNLTKCIFENGGKVLSVSGGGLVVDHCVFFGMSSITNSTGSIVRNTIFATATSPLYQCTGSSVQNCLTYEDHFFGNSSGTVTNSYINEVNPFIDEADDNYDFSDDLGVINGSAASGGALDGTDMGLYGSSFPSKLGAVPFNPHFISVEIAPATDGNGNLPVTIKTQAQTY